MDGTVCEYDPGLGCVLDGILGLALLTRNTGNATAHVIALEVLHVLYLKGL